MEPPVLVPDTFAEHVVRKYNSKLNFHRLKKINVDDGLESLDEDDQNEGILPQGKSAFGFQFQLKTSPDITDRKSLMIIGLSSTIGYKTFSEYPTMIYENGGLVFVLVQAIITLVLGLPTILAQGILGRYFASGIINTHEEACPLLGGLGSILVIQTVLMQIGSTTHIAVPAIYFVRNFNMTTPWKEKFEALPGCNVSSHLDYLTNAVFKHCSHSFQNYGPIDFTLAGYFALVWLFVCGDNLLRHQVGWDFTRKSFYLQMVIFFTLTLIVICLQMAFSSNLGIIVEILSPDICKLGQFKTWKNGLLAFLHTYEMFLALSIFWGVRYQRNDRDLLKAFGWLVLVESVICLVITVVVVLMFSQISSKYGLSADDLKDYSGIVLISIAFERYQLSHTLNALGFILLMAVSFSNLSVDTFVILDTIKMKFPALQKTSKRLVMVHCFVMYLLTLSIAAPVGLDLSEFVVQAMSDLMLFVEGLEVILIGWIIGADQLMEWARLSNIKMSHAWENYLRATWRYTGPMCMVGICFCMSIDYVSNNAIVFSYDLPMDYIGMLMPILYAAILLGKAYNGNLEAGGYRNALKSQMKKKFVCLEDTDNNSVFEEIKVIQN